MRHVDRVFHLAALPVRSPRRGPAHVHVSTAVAIRVLGWTPAVTLVSGLSRLLQPAADDGQLPDPILTPAGAIEERIDV